MKISGISAAAAFAVVGFGGAASAQGLDQFCLDSVDYLCGGGMVGSCFSVQANWEDLPNECVGDVQTLIEMEREALEQQAQDFGNAQSQEDFCNQAVENICGMGLVGDCFADQSMWQNLPDECVGNVQTTIEMEREALEQQFGQQDFGTNDGSDGMVPNVVQGLSLGGQLRAGPGQEYDIVATLNEGDYVGVIEYTDVYFQDYPWFYVDSPFGTGYHWGGIICTYEYIDGVYSGC